MQDTITVFVHYESQTLPVTVSPLDTVSSIEDALPADGLQKRLFCGDVEICPAFTLAYLGIRHGDHIIAVGVDTTRDAKLSLRPKHRSVESEKARLNDQFMSHVQSTTKTFRKMVNRFVARGGKSTQKKSKAMKMTTVIPPEASTPATEKLPSFW